MQTDNIVRSGNTPDLLSGILNLQVRNEEKITELALQDTRPD